MPDDNGEMEKVVMRQINPSSESLKELPQDIIEAAEKADWQQVVLNQGPPCFHLEGGHNPQFCLRAKRWAGHDSDHKYVPLDGLLIHALREMQASRKAVLPEEIKEVIRWLKVVRPSIANSERTPYEQRVQTLLTFIEQQAEALERTKWVAKVAENEKQERLRLQSANQDLQRQLEIADDLASECSNGPPSLGTLEKYLELRKAVK